MCTYIRSEVSSISDVERVLQIAHTGNNPKANSLTRLSARRYRTMTLKTRTEAAPRFTGLQTTSTQLTIGFSTLRRGCMCQSHFFFEICMLLCLVSPCKWLCFSVICKTSLSFRGADMAFPQLLCTCFGSWNSHVLWAHGSNCCPRCLPFFGCGGVDPSGVFHSD